jgi:hypothetical protein
MLFNRSSLVLLLIGSLIASISVQAPPVGATQQQQEKQQRHVLGEAEMEGALARSATAEAADREAIRALLRDQRVQQIAGNLGLEIKTADAAVSTLEGAELGHLADGARAVELTLAGGQQSITITYTAIIIILLVLILLVLVV